MIRSSDKFQELPAALQAMQADGLFVTAWRENKGIKGGNARYANLADVMIAAIPMMNKHRIGCVQFPGEMKWLNNMHVISISTRIFHASGEWMEDTGDFPFGTGPVNSEGRSVMNPNQSYGSSLTYSKRIALLSALGMITGNDDDAQEMNKSVARGQDSSPKPGNYQEPPEEQDQTLNWTARLDDWREQPAPGHPGKTLEEMDSKQMAEIRKNYYLLNAAVVAEMGDWSSIYMNEFGIEWGTLDLPENDGPWPASFFECSPVQVRRVFVVLKSRDSAK